MSMPITPIPSLPAGRHRLQSLRKTCLPSVPRQTVTNTYKRITMPPLPPPHLLNLHISPMTSPWTTRFHTLNRRMHPVSIQTAFTKPFRIKITFMITLIRATRNFLWFMGRMMILPITFLYSVDSRKRLSSPIRLSACNVIGIQHCHRQWQSQNHRMAVTKCLPTSLWEYSLELWPVEDGGLLDIYRCVPYAFLKPVCILRHLLSCVQISINGSSYSQKKIMY